MIAYVHETQGGDLMVTVVPSGTTLPELLADEADVLDTIALDAADQRGERARAALAGAGWDLVTPWASSDGGEFTPVPVRRRTQH
ncbi:hypothetical protein ACWEVD_00435 [Nocardia thailandica]